MTPNYHSFADAPLSADDRLKVLKEALKNVVPLEDESIRNLRRKLQQKKLENYASKAQEARLLGLKMMASIFIFVALLAFLLVAAKQYKMAHQGEFFEGGEAFRDKLLTSLYSHDDACSSFSSGEKTQCCSSTKYPVLRGLDVVALHEVHKGNLPLIGTIEHPAALPTSQGTYVFFFATKENQQQFIEDPWRYTPKWGGFDGWEIAQNNRLKGDSAKGSIGVNTDVSLWVNTMEGEVVMLGTEEGKKGLVADLDHWIAKGDEKWLGWFGEKDGPFNTRCFQGGISDEDLGEAATRYAAGELPLGAVAVRDSLLARLDRAGLRNAKAEARVLLAGGASFLVEEGRALGFDLQRADAAAGGAAAAAGLAGLRGPSATLPSSAGVGGGAVFAVRDGALVRVDGDGTAAATPVADLAAGAAAPLALAVDPGGGGGGGARGAPRLLAAFADGTLAAYPLVDDDDEGRGAAGAAATAAAAAGPGPGPGPLAAMAVWDGALYFATASEPTTLRRAPLLPAAAATTGEEAAGGPAAAAVVGATDGAWGAALPGPLAALAPWEDGLLAAAGDRLLGCAPEEEETLPSCRALRAAGGVATGLAVGGGRLWWATAGGVVSSAPLAGLGLPGAAQEALRLPAELAGPAALLGVLAWAAPDGLGIAASTKYTERGDPAPFSDYPWLAGTLVEPFLPTVLRAASPAAAQEEEREYEWVFRGRTTQGPTLEVTLDGVGEWPLTLREHSAGAAPGAPPLRELRTAVVGRRVRRELRALLPEDREAFLQAMEEMFTLSREDGLARYGPTFKTSEYFVHLHNVWAGARDCDHLHQGKGFLNNHLALTLEFEQSMQMINPALTMPYWDYTLESHDVLKNHGGDLDAVWSSEVFRPEFFGDADPVEHTVTEGRWAHKLRVAGDQWDNQRRNSYGLMRAPWNNNPSPYVQRFRELSGSPLWNYNDGWPTCKDHYEVSVAHPTFTEYLARLPGWAHGTVHAVMGGAVNPDGRLDRLAALFSEKDVTNIRGRTPHIPKDMWRKGLVECPDFCDPETTPLDECRCACPASQLERSEWDRDLFELYVGSALNARMLGQYSEEDLRKGIEIVCNAGILVGDEEQSSSPADPLFWPIHPTIERLYQWKMLNGGFEDDTWPETGNYNSPIYVGTMAMCTGHNPNDLLPWKLRLGREQQARSYTNAELRNLIDPSSPEYQLPYVYDHFQWKHCAEEGYDFDQIGWRSV